MSIIIGIMLFWFVLLCKVMLIVCCPINNKVLMGATQPVLNSSNAAGYISFFLIMVNMYS